MLEYKQKRNNGRTPFAGVYKFVCVCVKYKYISSYFNCLGFVVVGGGGVYYKQNYNAVIMIIIRNRNFF